MKKFILLLSSVIIVGNLFSQTIPKGFIVAQEGKNFKLYKNEAKKVKKLSINGGLLKDFPYSLIIEGVHPNAGLIVITDDNKKIGLADSTGKILLPCKHFIVMQPDTIAKVVWVRELYPYSNWENDGNLPFQNWKMYDFKGQLKTPNEFAAPFKISNKGIGFFRNNELFGIWKDNKIAETPQYERAYRINDQLVGLKKKYQTSIYKIEGDMWGKYYTEEVLRTGDSNVVALRDGGLWGFYRDGAEQPYMSLHKGWPEHDIASIFPKWVITGWVQQLIKTDTKNLPQSHKNLLFNHVAHDFLERNAPLFARPIDFALQNPYYFANDYTMPEREWYKSSAEDPSGNNIIEAGSTPMTLSFIEEKWATKETETQFYTRVKSMALGGGYKYDGAWSKQTLDFVLDTEGPQKANFATLFLTKTAALKDIKYTFKDPEDIWRVAQKAFIIQPEGIYFLIGKNGNATGQPTKILLTWKELAPFNAKKDAYQYNVFMD